MKHIIKPLIAAGLLLAALPIKPAAALRQVAARVAHTGTTLQAATILKSAGPAVRRLLPLTQTTRALTTLSQSHKSYSNHKINPVDFAPLIPLGVVAAVTGSKILDELEFANSPHEKLMERLKKEPNPIKKRTLAFKILDTKFNSLSRYELAEIFYQFPQSEEKSSWILNTLNTKLDTLSEDKFSYLLNALPQSEETSSWILNTLNTKFDTLSEDKFSYLLNALPQSEEKHSWIIKILDTKFDLLDEYIINKLLKKLTADVKNSWIFKILETQLDTLSEDQLCYLLYALPESEETSSWILNTLETKLDTLSKETLYYLLKTLPESEETSSWILNTLNTKFDTLSEGKLFYLLDALPQSIESEETYSFILKILENKVDFSKQRKLFSLLVKKLPINKAKPFIDLIIRENPLLENLSHFKGIGPLFSATFLQYCIETIPTYTTFQELLPLITEDAVNEYTNNRIVFYHGQSAQWTLLADIYEALYSLKDGSTFPANFVPLRFTTQSSITNKDVNQLLKNGVYKTSCRPHILFGNLHIFSNDSGSNTWDYITKNYDQSTNSGRYKFIENLTNIFNDLDFSEELETLKEEFIMLQDIYTKAVEHHGNQGSLIVISMPKALASRISYCAHPGGFINPITINGTPTTDPAVIAAHFDQVPFENEYCICLTKEILDPIEAEKAGVKIKRFSPLFDQQTQEGQEYIAALDKVMKKIKILYQARMAREAITKSLSEN